MYSEYWDTVEGYNARLLDSVILQTGERERLISDIEKFKGSKARYRHLGVPYHRGYLLYGPPGTGKTSLVSAIAGKFAMSIYAINLTDFNDRSLTKAMNDVPPGSVVLFEDVDCMMASNPRSRAEKPAPADPREKPDGKSVADKFGVTLSGLLNVLDGFHAPDGVLYMMTTNKIEALDPALLRPGRIDYRLYLGVASDEQKRELYRRFFPQAEEFEGHAFVEAHLWAETMADFRACCWNLRKSLRVCASSKDWRSQARSRKKKRCLRCSNAGTESFAGGEDHGYFIIRRLRVRIPPWRESCSSSHVAQVESIGTAPSSPNSPAMWFDDLEEDPYLQTECRVSMT